MKDSKIARATRTEDGKVMIEQPVTLRLEQDILRWFKDQGPGYQTRINAVLRQYKNAHEIHK